MQKLNPKQTTIISGGTQCQVIKTAHCLDDDSIFYTQTTITADCDILKPQFEAGKFNDSFYPCPLEVTLITLD